jgi:tetratricopeptide (TPR) repeat protein
MRGGHDGLLTVSFGKHERQIGFLQGRPVYHASNVAEDALTRTLVQSKLIPRKRMVWIEKKLGPEESLQDAVIFTGTLEPDVLNGHLDERLRTTLGSPLRWGTGFWTFLPLTEFGPSTVDARLLPSLDGVQALWQGVLQQVSVEEAFPVVTSEEGVPYQAHQDLDEWMERLKLEGPLSALVSELKAGRTTTELFQNMQDNTGTLPRLLWFLEVGGLVHRQGSAVSIAAATLVERLLMGLGEVEQEPIPEEEVVHEGATAIAELHRARMESDYYTFAGIHPDTTEDLRRLGKKVLKDWSLMGADSTLPEKARQQLAELIRGLDHVLSVLTDPEQREAYDQQLECGTATVVRATPSATPETLAAVRDAQESGREKGTGKDTSVGATNREDLTDEERELLEMGGSNFKKEAEEEDEDASVLKGGKKNKDAPTASHASARVLVEGGDYKGALPLLEKARFECPTSPDVLADLAWCTWRMRDFNPTAQHEADEYLRLALSFDGHHVPTLEYQARVALEMEDHDAAVQALKRLLNVEPGHEWATRFLEEQGENQGKGIFSLFKRRTT